MAVKSIPTWKYFKGCISLEAVKDKYKDLAKKLHPDAGGTHEEFVAMGAEYSYIKDFSTSVVWPIGSISQQKQEFHSNNFGFGTPEYNEKVRQAFAQAERQRVIRYFEEKRKGDIGYDIIDSFRNTTKDLSQILIYMNKLEDLNEDHFKYICFMFGQTVNTARVFYKNYLNNKIGW